MSDGGGADILVYQWLAWKGYLVTSLWGCSVGDHPSASDGRNGAYRAVRLHLMLGFRPRKATINGDRSAGGCIGPDRWAQRFRCDSKAVGAQARPRKK